MTATVLTHIINDKRQWLSERMQQQPLASFQHLIQASKRNFYQALTSDRCIFILECKKASPSKGLIRPDFNPQAIADVYGGYATAISVLTDEKYFQGSFDYLTQVSQRVKQPVLCKDFIIDPYQIYLARHYQADAILLMLSVLDDEQYRRLAQVAHQLNMGVLTEVSNEQELERASTLKAKVVGINNRDLRDLSIDLNRTKQLAVRLPKETIVISESGLYSHQQLRELRPFANGFLIGSVLMAEENLELAVRKILFGGHKICGLTRVKDAQTAAQAGVVYGGVIFAEHSPRRVTRQQAEEIISSTNLNWIGLFSNQPLKQVAETAHHLSLFAVQLHGEEDRAYIVQLRKLLPDHCQIWQACSVTDRLPTTDCELVDCFLFDNGKGGTGQAFDWSLLANQRLDKVMLAGGLNIDNLTEALTFKVNGLDFNSGLESAPGIKDANKINALFAAIKSY